MEVKKNPKADLSLRSLFFFQIGMIAMLFVSWQALEWKSDDRSNLERSLVDVTDDLDEVIPITDLINPPPPPPPASNLCSCNFRNRK